MLFFNAILAAFVFIFVPALAAPQSPGHPPVLDLTYSGQYDNAKLSLTGVACSNGPNGLLTKGYKTLGDLKNFPYVGAAQYIEGWNSANCGSCYKLIWGANSIYVLGVDHVANGFVISKAALDKLTGGQAVQLGKTDAAVIGVPSSYCQI
ncbi:hypothetical protein NLI96_g6158 [Meripilus lineatus]|uniref:Cerato-platanin n=1 Tax=Meripilus lineatus TaxID=2056292 RepID=A0AAD5V1M4_9APHY|nr:hypothetical protein NLI96_g6158 [Physisporinus lineatus]